MGWWCNWLSLTLKIINNQIASSWRQIVATPVTHSLPIDKLSQVKLHAREQCSWRTNGIRLVHQQFSRINSVHSNAFINHSYENVIATTSLVQESSHITLHTTNLHLFHNHCHSFHRVTTIMLTKERLPTASRRRIACVKNIRSDNRFLDDLWGGESTHSSKS